MRRQHHLPSLALCSPREPMARELFCLCHCRKLAAAIWLARLLNTALVTGWLDRTVRVDSVPRACTGSQHAPLQGSVSTTSPRTPLHSHHTTTHTPPPRIHHHHTHTHAWKNTESIRTDSHWHSTRTEPRKGKGGRPTGARPTVDGHISFFRIFVLCP